MQKWKWNPWKVTLNVTFPCGPVPRFSSQFRYSGKNVSCNAMPWKSVIECWKYYQWIQTLSCLCLWKWISNICFFPFLTFLHLYCVNTWTTFGPEYSLIDHWFHCIIQIQVTIGRTFSSFVKKKSFQNRNQMHSKILELQLHIVSNF